MKIIIIFMGLIAQVNQPMSFDNTAVLLAAPEHEARLIIPLQSVIDPDDWLKKQPANGPNVEIDLKGATVRVKGTRGIFSGLQDTFTKASPAMETIVPGCKLRDEVRKRQIVPGELAAYIDFRGGRVLPEAYLPKKLSFKGTPLEEARCTVCRVRYVADLHGDHATLILKRGNETHEIKVKGNTEIKVSNRPSHAIEHHFDKQFNIYVGQCSSKQVHPLVTEEKCMIGPLCEQLKPLPNGAGADPGDDCTVVRHP